MDRSETACVLIPVKSFALAKNRLSTAMDPEERETLARAMAEIVITAAAPLPVWCVCEDEVVADWAHDHGAQVDWTPGLGLNAAVQESVRRRREDGTPRVVVSHGDLPFASGLARLADAADHDAILVPDRHGRGTNVISVPTSSGFRFSYGPDSFGRHVEEAERCGLAVLVDDADHLGWDVDEPDDLLVPVSLGRLPGVGA